MYETQILVERYYWVFQDSDSQFACGKKEAILFWGYLEDAIYYFFPVDPEKVAVKIFAFQNTRILKIFRRLPV